MARAQQLNTKWHDGQSPTALLLLNTITMRLDSQSATAQCDYNVACRPEPICSKTLQAGPTARAQCLITSRPGCPIRDCEYVRLTQYSTTLATKAQQQNETHTLQEAICSRHSPRVELGGWQGSKINSSCKAISNKRNTTKCQLVRNTSCAASKDSVPYLAECWEKWGNPSKKRSLAT